MKGFVLILACLASGMLLFGCTYSAESSVNNSASGSADAPASGGSQNPSGGASSGASPPSGTGGNTQPATGGSGSGGTAPPEPQAGGSAAIDMSGKGYSDLVGVGSGSRCAVSYKSETGAPLELALYFDGKHNIRMEQETGYSDCPEAVVVYKGDSSGNGMLYTTCPGHEEEALGQMFGTHEQCYWKAMDIEEQWGGIGTSSLGLEDGYSTPMIEYLDSPQYGCQSWTPEPSKFETPGFVCD